MQQYRHEAAHRCDAATRSQAAQPWDDLAQELHSLAARAQQPKLPTIGYLGPSTRSLEVDRLRAFVQQLGELGWIEGRTVAIEYHWAEGGNEHLAEIAASFVRRKMDVILTAATPPTVVAKQATSIIPIVFAAVGDPIGIGVSARGDLRLPAASVCVATTRWHCHPVAPATQP